MTEATPRPDAVTRARELRDAEVPVGRIAEMLQSEGYLTVRGGPWTRRSVSWMLNSSAARSFVEAPCLSCGRPTASTVGVCARPSCVAEYYRRMQQQAPPKPYRPVADTPEARGARNNAVRRSRQAQKGELSVYAVWFPKPQVLKVGFTGHTQNSIFVSVARRKAPKYGWDIRESSCIWKQPGDVRTEAWMQATLSFRWWPAFDQKHNRICEWLKVPGLPEKEIVGTLDEVYRLVPNDVRGDGPRDGDPLV